MRPIWRDDRRDDAPPRVVGSLPPTFPVFPLSRALLLPGSHLPLNIFEPRYLNLVEAALAAGRMFGMVQPRSRNESGTGQAPVANLHRVGCLGRITSFAETEDGCFVLTLAGLARFEIDSELPVEHGFRSVRARFERFAADLLPETPIVIDRNALLGLLRQYFQARGLDANWDAIEDMSDGSLVSTLCMACPFSDAEKQALLEAPDDQARARSLEALLTFGLHETGEGRPRHAS